MINLYDQAFLLPDNEQLVIRYQIGSSVSGRMTLSNSIKLMSPRNISKLKKVLDSIKDFVIDTYSYAT